MAKVLLVEDDVNLREIYAARLQSEGYDTLTADDGENALAIAVKEKPDLIILDVMMPKISGFDVLDILRSTPETKNAKIMMMTALSQDGDKERGEKLGANRYLVKSQVTLEDMVGNVKQLLEEGGVSATPQPAPTEQPAQTPVAEPTPEPAAEATPAATPVAPEISPVAPAEPSVSQPAPQAVAEPVQEEAVVADAPVQTETQAPQTDPVVAEPVVPTAPVVDELVQTVDPNPIEQSSAPQLEPNDMPPQPDPAISDDIDDSVIATPGTVIQPTTAPEPVDENRA